ncbi:MAG: 30S ribosomal protein S12 methylthiotransferase RimO, partial [Saprospiraceae bacterium]|nr:30S ribosomal protein S12 methylthiotransferase RimO [Saprospiraceae bacterium]
IDLAKEESINTILEYAKKKKKGKIDKLYVTGCLSQRYKDDLMVEIPEVDAFFGTMELPNLLKKLNADYKQELVGERWISTPLHYAYLKISEGCNRTCSFCAIPLMRGNHVSKPIESLVKEAKNLAAIGVKELILIAQELTYYGLDIYKKRSLSDLLNELCAIEGIEWIRLHYAYPSKFPLDVIETMAKQPKICKYLDIPLQHASDAILDKMKRQITREETKQIINDIRKILPEITLRTTFLIGFPGESEEDIDILCKFIEEMQFDRVGVFKYSHEDDTAAFKLEDDVPDEIKAERMNRVMEIQSAISYKKNLNKIENVYKVLIDRKEGEFYYGRTEGDSPEVDNEVLINANEHYLRIGEFITAKIFDADEFDIYAEPI